jgi:hypothetical protein
MYEQGHTTAVHFLEPGVVHILAQIHIVDAGGRSDAIQFQHVKCIFHFLEATIDITTRQGCHTSEARGMLNHHLGNRFVHPT